MLGKPSRRTRKKLEEHGKRAPAVVVEIADKGMTVTSGSGQLVSDTEVMLKTKLRVEPEDEPAFEVEERMRYPQLSIPSVGSRLAVIYDPSDHDKVMLDSSPEGVASQFVNVPGLEGTDLKGLMATVEQARAHTNDPQEMARILQQQLGTSVNVQQQDSRSVAFGTAPAGFGAPAAQPEEDHVDKLAKLAELREKGMLTDAEFESEKARILGES
jgi:hypothetical protein